MVNKVVRSLWKRHCSSTSCAWDQRKGVVGLLTALKLSCKARDLVRVKTLHKAATQIGLESNIVVANTLVDAYGKCGSMEAAKIVFDRMLRRDVVSWTVLMMGYVASGAAQVALDLFDAMVRQGVSPDPRSYVAAIKACTTLTAFNRGLDLHAQVVQAGCELQVYVASTLLSMYVRFGNMSQAHKVFDQMVYRDVVCWTTLMLGYADRGEGQSALVLFACMFQEDCEPDARIFMAAIKACATLAIKEYGQELDGIVVKSKSLAMGMSIHSQASSCGCSRDIFVESVAIDMYVKCGFLPGARRIFETMNIRNVVSWTPLILGYAESGQGDQALELFSQMCSQRHKPDALTFMAALKSCGTLASLETGRSIHARIRSQGLDKDPVVANAVVDFYSKCGSMEEAQHAFDAHLAKDLVTWTSLIAGYGRQGNVNTALSLFHAMQDSGIQPDAVAFLCILTVCSHTGLLDLGRYYFDTMVSKHGIQPEIEHYVCMVDMLGRANKLEAALSIVKGMPIKPTFVTWMTVLGACNKWKNVEVGRVAFQALLSLDDRKLPLYLLMGNIYASRGMWEEQAKVEALRMVKAPSFTRVAHSQWTDPAAKLHTFMSTALEV